MGRCGFVAVTKGPPCRCNARRPASTRGGVRAAKGATPALDSGHSDPAGLRMSAFEHSGEKT